ncbi:GNAT family N-acetyltransferase [Oceanobacillus sp. CF4.6]|uniref:GNAT family N-acetyltransferase n=1 Tax=Oceanobacillus sp. CF4.6 TaxID=3373080 RepID=UPI003EE60E6A
MEDKIKIKQLTKMEQLKEVQHIEELVWHMPPTPLHQTYTGINNGGMILGAYEGDKMVGFLYSFPGFDGKNAYLCSHMMGILKEYRKIGIGKKIKVRQAEIAKKMGYEMVTWTFDPLESVNAYLNLHKLGARGTDFKGNHYGDLQNEFSEGLPSDRIQIMWDISEPCREKDAVVFDETKVLITMDVEKRPVINDNFHVHYNKHSDVWFVEIPTNFQEIKQKDLELAKDWRQATKKVFNLLFDDGYQADDFIHSRSECSYYIFTR